MNLNLIILVLVIWAQDTYTKQHYRQPSSKWQFDDLILRTSSKKQASNYLITLKGFPRYEDYLSLMPSWTLMQLKGSGKNKNLSKLKGKKKPHKKPPKKPKPNPKPDRYPKHDQDPKPDDGPKLSLSVEFDVSGKEEYDEQ